MVTSTIFLVFCVFFLLLMIRIFVEEHISIALIIINVKPMYRGLISGSGNRALVSRGARGAAAPLHFKGNEGEFLIC